VEKSKAFFTGLGFELNPQFPENEDSAAILIGDNLQLKINHMVLLNQNSPSGGFL
jgi:hypothetical protein